MKGEGRPDSQSIRTLWATIADREARLLALVEASAHIVWVTDEDGNVMADPPKEIAHLTWSAFTGLTQESMRGRGWAAAVHSEDLPTLAHVTRQARQSGGPLYCEFRLRHKSGEWRWMLCRGNAVRNHDLIVGWIGTCTDITVAKQTEQALRESQQRLVAALEAGGISTWIWRIADNTFWWDDAGIKLWGLDPARAYSHDLSELQALIDPEDRSACQRAMEQTVLTGIACTVEFRTVRADGQLQWLSSRGTVHRNANGEVDSVVGAFADITKLKATEESLRQAQKMQALGTLAGGIAHDFNNLLLTISGNARLALEETPEHHPSNRSLREIAQAASRATDLVRRILTFSARQPHEPSATLIMPAIDEALRLLLSSVPPNVSIRTHCDDAELACTLGSAELQQVVVNLVTNAIHAIGSDEGTIDIAVSADVLPNGGESSPSNDSSGAPAARIVIRDTGCGIGAGVRARIFEPFFTTKPPGKGTGLGLAVVHGMVQGCGGAIEVDSDVGRGTVFALRLPRVDGVALVAQRVAPARGAGEHILYVDDDDSINFLIKRLLEQRGYSVTCSNHPANAREIFAENPFGFDVVITDLSMPGMSGFELLAAIKAIRTDVPTILTSGYVREEDQLRATKLGIDFVILKPNTIDELGVALDKICRELASNRTRETEPAQDFTSRKAV